MTFARRSGCLQADSLATTLPAIAVDSQWLAFGEIFTTTSARSGTMD